MKSIEAQLEDLGCVKDCQGVMPTLREIEDIAYLLARERNSEFDRTSSSVDIFHSADMYGKCVEVVMGWYRDVGGTLVKDFTKGNCFGMRVTTVRTPTIELNFVDADCMCRLRPETLAAIAMSDIVYHGKTNRFVLESKEGETTGPREGSLVWNVSGFNILTNTGPTLTITNQILYGGGSGE